MKKKILVLCVTMLSLLGLFVIAACGNSSEEPGFAKHKITVQSTDECALSVDKTEAEFGETVTVTANLKVTDKYIEEITYNGQSAVKRSETTYDFLVKNDDVEVAAVLKAYTEQLTDGNSFATFSSSNTKTLAKNSGKVNLKIALNGSYMTILNWNIQSSNQSAIPGSSVNSSSNSSETGAITAETSKGSTNNLINALNIYIDTDQIANGDTFLLIDLANGNVSSQKASLVVKITVADSIITTKWTETLTFDLSALPSSVRSKTFTVQLSDFDFVSGSDNKEYQIFQDVSVSADNKIQVTVEYVPGHRYYVSLFTDTSTFYKLSDSVGQGTTATGYCKLQDNLLTMIADGQTLTITVVNETIR